MKVKHTREVRPNVNHQDGGSRGESAFLHAHITPSDGC